MRHSFGRVRERFVAAGGHRLLCLEAGAPGDPLLLLLHGFPELAFSWRHQLEPLAAAGWHVVAPDLPGYGRSDKPDVDYDVVFVGGTLRALVDALGHDRVVVAGHDWGAILTWHFARMYDGVVDGAIGLNVPDLARPPIPPVELLRQIFGATPPYIVQFQERGAAEWVLSWGRGADDFVELMFRNPLITRHTEAFGDAVLDVYKAAFRPAGALTPPLEYYRNLDRNWQLSVAWDAKPITVPVLMISAADDPVVPPTLVAGMDQRCLDLTHAVIDDCGHWTQQEQPERTTELIVEFLSRLR